METIVTFRSQQPQFAGVNVEVKPLEQRKRGWFLGEVQNGANVIELMYRVCDSQVRGFSGLDIDYRPGRGCCDKLPPELVTEIGAFIVDGCKVTENESGD